MQPYQQQFIELALNENVLQFGEFTLKSGRQSPYFFNAGLFNTGSALKKLADCYAKAILENNLKYDVLFGPAYKGIPLVAAIAISLSEMTGEDVPFAFNRKEAKAHGEGGMIVGTPIKGKRLLIVDDVITAGTAINEVIDIAAQAGAQVSCAMLALDREELVADGLSATQRAAQQHGITVACIANVTNLLDWVKSQSELAQWIEKIEDYRSQYGIKS